MTAAAQQTTEKWKYVGVASDGHTKEKEILKLLLASRLSQR